MITDSQFETLKALIKLISMYDDAEVRFSFNIQNYFIPCERMRYKFDIYYKCDWHSFFTCQEAIEFLSAAKLTPPDDWDGEKTPMMIQQENAAMQVMESEE